MTTPKPILIAQGIFARLQKILRADGYHTDAGQHVTRGWGMQAISDAGELPLIAMHPASNSVSQRNFQHSLHERAWVIEAVVDVDVEEAPADALDLLYDDIMKALDLAEDETLGGLAATVGLPVALYQIPEDGSRLAVLTITLPITYITKE